MNALNKLIQERFADITQGASADVYPLTVEEVEFIEFCAGGAARVGAPIGTDQIDNLICQLLENRNPTQSDLDRAVELLAKAGYVVVAPLTDQEIKDNYEGYTNGENDLEISEAEIARVKEIFTSEDLLNHYRWSGTDEGIRTILDERK